MPVISPLVRRRAREHGVDLRALTGSGPDGLILRADVERAIADRAAPAEPAARPEPAAEPRPDGDAVREPLRGAARAAAEKFTRSHRDLPAATCWVDADATGLLALRDRLGAPGAPPGAPRVGLLALLARITVAALARHPELNASVTPDGDAVLRHRSVHLGIAAQTDRGLRVPVIRDAQALTTDALAAAVADTAARARDGSLPPAALTGGTFTLNNYGVFGVDGSTPLLNAPEAGMLGVGRIVRKPWAHGDELALRHVTTLSCTFDHRVCDGAVAGGFLRFVADCVEDPTHLLRHV